MFIDTQFQSVYFSLQNFGRNLLKMDALLDEICELIPFENENSNEERGISEKASSVDKKYENNLENFINVENQTFLNNENPKKFHRNMDNSEIPNEKEVQFSIGNIHIKVHENAKTHKCELCSRQFIQETYLKKHIKTVHEGVKNDNSSNLNMSYFDKSVQQSGKGSKGTKECKDNDKL